MIRVGTSGWRYAGWRRTFYPEGLVQRRELEYLSRQLNSVEINGSFYSLQSPSSYRSWFDETPDDFVFSVKGPRFITHMKKLRDVEEPLANFLASGVLRLGHKLGPILWQLPPNLSYDEERLRTFAELLPRSTAQAADVSRAHGERMNGRSWTTTDVDQPLRHALEVRHPSFTEPAAVQTIRELDMAVVLADSAQKFPAPDETTADFTYARLHGDQELYVSGYDEESLDAWAARFRAKAELGDVFVYFDNDAKVHAPYDALSLLRRVQR